MDNWNKSPTKNGLTFQLSTNYVCVWIKLVNILFCKYDFRRILEKYIVNVAKLKYK